MSCESRTIKTELFSCAVNINSVERANRKARGYPMHSSCQLWLVMRTCRATYTIYPFCVTAADEVKQETPLTSFIKKLSSTSSSCDGEISFPCDFFVQSHLLEYGRNHCWNWRLKMHTKNNDPCDSCEYFYRRFVFPYGWCIFVHKAVTGTPGILCTSASIFCQIRAKPMFLFYGDFGIILWRYLQADTRLNRMLRTSNRYGIFLFQVCVVVSSQCDKLGLYMHDL